MGQRVCGGCSDRFNGPTFGAVQDVRGWYELDYRVASGLALYLERG